MTGPLHNRPVVARWREWLGDGLQHLILKPTPQGRIAEALVLSRADSRPYAARFRIVVDGVWRTRRIEAQVLGDDRQIDLYGDGVGRWTDGEDRHLSHLDGAIDVDLPLTPFTNTLPIHRLNLAAGQSADIDAVYVRLPEFTVVTDPQRYVCIEPLRRYRYESLDSDFVCEIALDANGLVLDYPGLFRRLG
jgi:hypothetical protein